MPLQRAFARRKVASAIDLPDCVGIVSLSRAPKKNFIDAGWRAPRRCAQPLRSIRKDTMNNSAEGRDTNSNPGNAAVGDPVSEILKVSRTIAVVGISSRKFRPSYGVAEYLQSAGYRIIPVNPAETEVLGEKCYARLEDVPERVDIVDIFRRSEFVPEIVESAIRIGARAVWMQEGVVHPEAAESARRAGLLVVMDTCILKEHVKRFRLQ